MAPTYLTDMDVDEDGTVTGVTWEVHTDEGIFDVSLGTCADDDDDDDDDDD